jgi:hypothetical protein
VDRVQQARAGLNLAVHQLDQEPPAGRPPRPYLDADLAADIKENGQIHPIIEC